MASAPQQPGYPAHWEADVLLLDGTAARLRPMRPTDADLLVDFYARVSPELKYKRFFAPYPSLSNRDVKRFTSLDYVDRVALIVIMGADMVGVGRYERLGGTEAEVAFLVEDDQQGRGIAQLLLEHLAQAGRERGVDSFVAEVMPDNVRMTQTLCDAGYRIESGLADGLRRLTFPLDPTDTSVGVMLSREHRSEASSMQRLLAPSSVAVVGASFEDDTIGTALVRNLVRGGYRGPLYVVNPAGDPVAGVSACDSVQAIPGEVELAILAVPGEEVADVVLDCAAKGAHGLIAVSSAFGEDGATGARRQRLLVGLARSYGLRLVGPNSLGVMNTATEVSLNASLAPSLPPPGRVGVFSQSGAFGVAVLDTVNRRGLGVSTFVSAGDRADVSGNDLLQYWEEDPGTDLVLLYLESIGNPRKFSRIARRVGRRKPVVAVKSGRRTQEVPVGHTVPATLAPPAAVDAMFRQAGVIQVDTSEEMVDVAQLLAHQPLPAGRRVAVVANSDVLVLLAADAAASAGLVVEKSVALGPDRSAPDLERALDDVVDSSSVDAVVAVFVRPLDTTADAVAAALGAVGMRSAKPVVSSFLGAGGVPELLGVPGTSDAARRRSVPSYRDPEAAVRALAGAVRHAEWLARPAGAIPKYGDIDTVKARRLAERMLSEQPTGGVLAEGDVATLLGSYGISVTPTTPVRSLAEAQDAGAAYGWNVALKATTERVRQRADLAHVWRTIGDADDMAAAWSNLTSIVDDPATAGFVVQPMAAPGVPLSIGSLEDPLFGPIVSFGLAGAPSELLGDVSYRIPPLTQADAADLVREPRAAPLLFGYRGSEPVDVPAVEELIVRLSQLKDDLAQVEVLDLQLVLAGAQGVSVLRATGRVAPAPAARSDAFTRRLSVPSEDSSARSG